MSRVALQVLGVLLLGLVCLVGQGDVFSQFPVDPQPGQQGPALGNPALGTPDEPEGIEVQARGPVHEAFATPTIEPRATPIIPKKPPVPIDELPPDQKPEGDVVWIGGYWAFDDERQDYLWVSGCWRTKPDNREWVPGYWRDVAGGFQWVPGFWSAVQAPVQGVQGQPLQREITYYPEPPAPPQIAPPGDPPSADAFYVPGYYVWSGNYYTWRAGYWGRVRPGYVYVPAHYRWTPYGHVYVAGYWDLAVQRRGVLYAPIVVTASIGPRFVYTPYYAVSDTLVLDALFIRPAHCHYYFGDYYGPRYRTLGFEASVVYARRHYDPIVTYQRIEYRDNPRWFDLQINLVIARDAGRAPLPPRTLRQQTTVIQNNTTIVNNNTTIINNVNSNNNNFTKNVLAPTQNVVAARGAKSVNVDQDTRNLVKKNSEAVQQASAVERRKNEAAPQGGGNFEGFKKPRTTSFNVPTAQAVQGNPGQNNNPNQGSPFNQKKGGFDNSVGNPNIGKGPIGNNPVGNNPVGNNPVGNNPNIGKSPFGNNPVGNNPVGNNPVGNNPNIGKNPLIGDPNKKGPPMTVQDPPKNNNNPEPKKAPLFTNPNPVGNPNNPNEPKKTPQFDPPKNTGTPPMVRPMTPQKTFTPPAKTTPFKRVEEKKKTK